MYPNSSQKLNYETEEVVYFFTPAFYPLDNYSAHQIALWGKTFATAEHAYQWKKFSESAPDVAQQILEAPSPEAVKKISEKYNNTLTPEWHQNKVDVMREILQAKAQQHEDVIEILKRTGNKRIVENSPVDSFWGSGPDGNGENWIGTIWIEIRDSML